MFIFKIKIQDTSFYVRADSESEAKTVAIEKWKYYQISKRIKNKTK